MRGRPVRWLAAVSAVGLAVAVSARAHAQGVIISGTTSARLIDMRPLVADSVPYASTSPWGDLRLTSDSVVVSCLATDAWCHYDRSGAVASLVALMQDVDIVGWGLGQGVSIHVQLRGRRAMGGGRELWPQANESFEALAAFVEADRERVRVRAGRQYLSSSLGYYNFDGGAVLWRIGPPVDVELYGGWTLLQGLAEPLTDAAMTAVEDLAPDRRGGLVGASVRAGVGALGSVRAQYQREISGGGNALYSERVAVNGEARVGPGMLAGAVTRDLSTGHYNELRLRYGLPLAAGLSVALQARHYEPFFELWTIWGAFSPVGYDEQTAQLQWSTPDGALQLGGSGGYRRYNSTSTGVVSMPLRTDGWRAGVDASFRPVDDWTLAGSYGVDVGFGASRSDVDAAIRWAPSERLDISLRGAALQDIYEFRVGSGRVLGAGFDGGWRFSPALRVAGDAMLYRQTGERQPNFADWNQWRGGIRLDWTVGGASGTPMGGSIR